MTIVEIKSNRDLIDFLKELEVSTKNYLDGGDELFDQLPKYQVYLLKDLDITEKVATIIGGMLKYFSGTFEGNNHVLNVSTAKPISLFSSVYYSVINNLIIHNVKGSKGFSLAQDALETEVNNVKVTGRLTVQDSMGTLFRTSMNLTMNHCKCEITTRSISKSAVMTDDDSAYSYFGGFIGTDLGGTVINHCEVTGLINSEVMVGGFVGVSKGTTFKQCSVKDLEITGLREVGLFVGRVEKKITLEDCKISSCKVKAGIYSGFIAGRSEGTIECNEVYLDKSSISSDTASSFIGGVSGTSKEIIMNDCHFEGNIYGNFVIAGVCPDADVTTIQDSTLDLEVTASGYHPMMTHAYDVVRKEYLTTRGKEPEVNVVDSDINVRVVELEMSGMINPFEEAIL